MISISVVGSNLSCKASLGSFTTYIRGVVVSVLASSVVYRGFQPWSSQTENYHKNVDIKFSAARHVSGITFQVHSKPKFEIQITLVYVASLLSTQH